MKRHRPREREYQSMTIVGELAGRGTIRIAPGEYVSLPTFLLPEDLQDGDRVRVSFTVWVKEKDDDSTTVDGAVGAASDGGTGQAEQGAEVG